MGRSLVLDVAAWAAIVCGQTVEPFGAAGDVSVIPAGPRRRLPPFARDVLRCALPLLREAPQTPVVYSSPNGDLDSTLTLLKDIARHELLSPALFALSVHNAPAGALSQCLAGPGDQISIAGDEATLSAGLVEAYARLASGECASLLLIHAEERLPETYAALDDETPGVFLALNLRLVGGSDSTDINVGAGRAGVVAVARALEAGQTRLRFTPPHMQALAA